MPYKDGTPTVDDVLAEAQEEVRRLRARVQDLESETGWRCFWCNAVFTDRAAAEIHFGPAHSDKPAPECLQLEIRARRDAEHANESLRARVQALEDWQRRAVVRIQAEVDYWTERGCSEHLMIAFRSEAEKLISEAEAD